MTESIIVGAILLAAAGFAGYRLFVRPSCGCGDGCKCGSKAKGKVKPARD